VAGDDTEETPCKSWLSGLGDAHLHLNEIPDGDWSPWGRGHPADPGPAKIPTPFGGRGAEPIAKPATKTAKPAIKLDLSPQH
jgi:hypothetical protein